MKCTAVSETIALIFLGLTSLSAETSERATLWHSDLKNKTFSIHGKFHSVNASAKTLTISVAKDLFVFTITGQTKVTKDGRNAPLNAATFDGELDLVMKVAPDGKGMAVSVATRTPVRTTLRKSTLQDGYPVPKKLYGRGFPTRR